MPRDLNGLGTIATAHCSDNAVTSRRSELANAVYPILSIPFQTRDKNPEKIKSVVVVREEPRSKSPRRYELRGNGARRDEMRFWGNF